MPQFLDRLSSAPSKPQRALALAVVYIALWVGMWHLAIQFSLDGRASLWYLPAGLTMALLLCRGNQAAPLPIIASLIAGLTLPAWPVWPYFLLASLAPPLSYILATQGLRSWMRRHHQEKGYFNDPQRVLLFLIAAVVASLLSALSGTGAFWWGAPSSNTAILEFSLNWWIGDLTGILTLTPLALIFVAPAANAFLEGKPWPRRVPLILGVSSVPLTLAQTGIVLLSPAALLWLSFQVWPEPSQPQPFLFLLLLPILAWIAATRGVRGAILTALLYEASIMSMLIWFGHAEQVLKYQIVMAAMAASGLLTGAASQAWFAHATRFRDLAEVSNDLIWEFDARGRLSHLSGQFAKSLDWRPGTGEFWRHYVDVASSHPQDPDRQETDFPNLEAAILAQQSFHQLVLRLRLPGREQPVWTLSSGLPIWNENGELVGYRGATTDMTEHKKVEELLRDYEQKLQAEVVERTRSLAAVSRRNWRLANFDSLTTLPNRNLFFEHLRKGLQQSRRQQRMAAILLVDLDGFKQINDTLGHEAGDVLLRQVADRLQHCVRASDTVARLGGDEFTIILLDLEQASGAENVASKIIERLARPVTLTGFSEARVTITASVGIALYHPEWHYTLDLGVRLLRDADAAMYAAKRAGKNCWRLAEMLEPEADSNAPQTDASNTPAALDTSTQ